MTIVNVQKHNNCDNNLIGENSWSWVSTTPKPKVSECEPKEILPNRGGVTCSNQTTPLVEGKTPFQNMYKSGTNKNTVISTDGARNWVLPRWRRPAAIYWTELFSGSTERNHENINQHSPCPFRVSNQTLLEYKSKALLFEAARSRLYIKSINHYKGYLDLVHPSIHRPKQVTEVHKL